MRFVPWYPLAEAGEHAPAAPGLFQVRVRSGLLEYPRGKSAMIHYQAAADVRAAAVAYAAAHPGVDWLCRHSEEMSAWELAHPRAVLDRLVDRFSRRFGAPPAPPR